MFSPAGGACARLLTITMIVTCMRILMRFLMTLLAAAPPTAPPARGGGGWRVVGEGWRVEGGGWRVEGGGWRVKGGVCFLFGICFRQHRHILVVVSVKRNTAMMKNM